MAHQNLRRRMILALKLVAGLGLLVWLVRSGRLDLAQFAAVGFSAKLGLFVAVLSVSLLLPALRWWWLLRMQDLQESFWRAVALTWASYFATLVLPGAASGDLAKGYFLFRRRPHTAARAFSTVLADRVIGVYSLLVLGGLAIVWLAARGEAGSSVKMMGSISLALLAGVTLIIGGLLWVPSRTILLRVLPASWREAWHESFDLYRAHMGGLIGCFFLSLVSNGLNVVAFALSAGLLGYELSWSTAFLVAPLVILANCLPLTPGGIGLAEAVSSELFAQLGTPGGANIMLLIRVGVSLLELPGLAVLLLSPARPQNANDASTGETSASPGFHRVH